MAELPYRIVIGLEVHVQLLTRTKLFCSCRTTFGLPPNSATCPVCIGMPGVLPVMNRHAFDLALRAALALNCQIARFTKWDRKNYYYPDLPKNYQISQYDLPFSHEGWLEIDTPAGTKKVGIIRAHLEEDAGKMMHDETGGGSDSLVDLNRVGTPLVEIVSKPDISSPEEARAYLEELRLLLRETGVSDCEMQEGSLRCDANINIHVPLPNGTVHKTPIVEVKNLNSFKAVERSTRYEAERHYKEAQKNPEWRFDRVAKETRGWDDARAITLAQRRKEEAADYRYFPEPDLVPVHISQEMLDQARSEMGELPQALRARLTQDHGLSPYDAGVLTHQGRALASYFEKTASLCGDAKAACNWVTNQVLATLKEQKTDIGDFAMAPEALSELIKAVKTTGLNMQRAREVYAHMLDAKVSAAEAIKKLGLEPVADSSQLIEIVRKAIAGNPKAVADFKAGKLKAVDALKGAVMKETRGRANMDMVQKLMMEELQKA